MYSIKSYYRLLYASQSDDKTEMWRKVWSLNIPEKVRNLIWHSVLNIFPIIDNLIFKWVEVTSSCPVYNADNKTICHSLITCHFAQCCWLASPVGFLGQFSSFGDWLKFILK